MERKNILSSLRAWLLSCYGKSPVCVTTLLGLLSLLEPPKVLAKDVNPTEAWATIQKNDANLRIVDVRTPKEYAEGHLPSAININVTDPNFPKMLQALDQSAPTLVYCRSGRRSKLAVTVMEGMGFRNILHMKDGWLAWEKEQLPIARDGQ